MAPIDNITIGTDEMGHAQVSIQNYFYGLRNQLIRPVHELAYNGEKRLYGWTVWGQADEPAGGIIVYCVVP